MEWGPWAAPIIVAILGAAVTLYGYKSTQRTTATVEEAKTAATVNATLLATYTTLVSDVQDERADARAERDKLKAEKDEAIRERDAAIAGCRARDEAIAAKDRLISELHTRLAAAGDGTMGT